MMHCKAKKGLITMNWENELFNENEKPLERLVDGYSNTSIFRTIAFIGDSLSSGEFETIDENGKHSYYDFFEYSWGQYMARKNGLLAYNFSRGGMSTRQYVQTFAEEKGYWEKAKACQAYVIALGFNDVYNGSMEIGSISDIDENDYNKNKQTFVGFYSAIVSRYKQISPDAKFFFVTLCNSGLPEKKERTEGMVEALYAMSQYFDNSYVINLYKYGPVYDDKFKEKFYLNGHMSPAGYILTARLIDSYIDYIIKHNYEDFKNVGFIGTGIEY